MGIIHLDIDKFIEMAPKHLVVDVRSPKEYQHAHYPGAFSLPLFSDEERKVVGTTYKQKSREQAIKVGLDYFGPKMKKMLNMVEQKLSHGNSRTVLVHCWRGGMRSEAIAWLLDLYGFEVYKLEGGYKKFRNWVLSQFETSYPLRILGGYTGSAKTEILHELTRQNYAVVDLEGIAGHKGSSFGNLDQTPQDSTEQFENKLALRLHNLRHTHFKEPAIWVESESSRIGNVNIPYRFFNQMKAAPRINIEVSFEDRLEFITQGYGEFATDKLVAATQRIKKRLGGLNTKKTIQYLQENKLKSAFSILLKYYDKAYDKSRKKFQEAALNIDLPGIDPVENTAIILEQTHYLKNVG